MLVPFAETMFAMGCVVDRVDESRRCCTAIQLIKRANVPFYVEIPHTKALHARERTEHTRRYSGESSVLQRLSVVLLDAGATVAAARLTSPLVSNSPN